MLDLMYPTGALRRVVSQNGKVLFDEAEAGAFDRRRGRLLSRARQVSAR